MSSEIDQSEVLASLDYHAILDSAPDAMILVDSSAKILFVNKQAETIFGYHRDELSGQRIEILVPDELAGHHPKLLEGFLKNPQTRNLAEGMELNLQTRQKVISLRI